jgi:hypothetical protein
LRGGRARRRVVRAYGGLSADRWSDG